MEKKWRNLPSDILGLVVQRLDETSIRYVRAVCSPWRSSVSCPKTYLPPIKIPFPVQPTGSNNERPLPPFVLTRTKLLAVSPLQGAITTPWIIQVEETGPNKWSLLDPIHSSHDRIPFLESELLPDHINLLDNKVIEISQSYNLILNSEVLRIGYAGYILRVVVIVNPSDGGGSSSIERGDYTLFVLFGATLGDPSSSTKLVIWYPHQNCWTFVYMDDYSPIDIVCYKCEVYGIESRGTLLRFDAATCLLKEVATEPEGCGYGVCYLVEFKQHLYLVNYYVYYDGVSIISHNVFVLDKEAGTWCRARNLGGGVFYLGYYNVLSISAKEAGLPNEDVVYIEGFSVYINPCSVMCELESYFTSVDSWWSDRPPFWPPPRWLA